MLSTQYKYGVIHSQMPPFQPEVSVVAPTVSAKATVASRQPHVSSLELGQADWDKVKRFSAPLCHGHRYPQAQAQATMKANNSGCSIGMAMKAGPRPSPVYQLSAANRPLGVGTPMPW